MPIKENNHRKKKREKVVTSQVRTRNEDFGGVALYHKHLIFVQSLSHVRLSVTPWTVRQTPQSRDSPGRNTAVG